MTAREIAEKLERELTMDYPDHVYSSMTWHRTLDRIEFITQALEEREREGYERGIADACQSLDQELRLIFMHTSFDSRPLAHAANKSIRSLAHPSRSEKGDL